MEQEKLKTIAELRKEKAELERILQEQQTIALCSFRNERIDHVYDDIEFLKDCAKQLEDYGLNKLHKKIYFDPNHSYNHNVRIHSMKHGLVEVFQDGSWKIESTTTVLRIMMLKAIQIIYKVYLDHFSDDERVLETIMKLISEHPHVYHPNKSNLYAMIVDRTPHIKQYVYFVPYVLPEDRFPVQHELDKLDEIYLQNCYIQYKKQKNKVKKDAKKNENFYQKVVEEYLNGSHQRLDVGITDITTDSIHAEIKHWRMFKNAIGQLISYNNEMPRERLQIYLFGDYDVQKKNKIVDCIRKSNIEVYTFKSSNENQVEIINYTTKEIVYVYNF